MAITQAMATSFKVEMLTAYHNFGTTAVRAGTGADTFKLSLYTSSATLDSTTTAYTASNEVGNSGSYAAGGGSLTISPAPTSTSTTAYLSFNNLTFTSATITARGAMIYNSTNGNRTVGVLDFGSDKTSTAGNFTITFPTADSSNAIIRVA